MYVCILTSIQPAIIDALHLADLQRDLPTSQGQFLHFSPLSVSSRLTPLAPFHPLVL